MHIHMYIINPAPTTTHHSICFLSSPSLFVFSLTFFLTFSRVNNNQTNTQKKINRSVYFSFIFFPFRYFFHQIDLSLLFCLMLLHIHAKTATKKLLHVRFPFLFSPPFLIVPCVCPYAKRKIRYMHEINLYAGNYNMKTKSGNFFVLLYFLRIAISFR